MEENLDLGKNVNIEEALKEFEAKNPEQVAKANEINQGQDVASALTSNPKISQVPEARGLVKLVMKLSGGSIKEQKQAESVLLVVTVLATLAALYFFFVK